MTKKSRAGYTNDLKLEWITDDLGVSWIQWQQFAAEWISSQTVGLDRKLRSIRYLMLYLNKKAPYASNVTSMFKGHSSGHKVSSEEFKDHLATTGVISQREEFITNCMNFIEFILKNHFSLENDIGDLQPLYANPFVRLKQISNKFETVYSPLPYRYIQQLRQILCPYTTDESSNKTPWMDRHFKHWQWAIHNLQAGNLAWKQISPKFIDDADPDCVWRTRLEKRADGDEIVIHEIWSPVIAMLLFTKLHLPLRTFQVRFLDSGEGDTWRYEHGQWIVNAKHSFKYGSPRRPYQKGVFSRIYDSMSKTYSTGLYISTNKTADQNKDDIHHGYTIPWEHKELLYWLEKLRNWQEKYNPISHLTKGKELGYQHIGKVKSTTQLEQMGEYAFLFRENKSKFPVKKESPSNPWYRLLSKLEDDVFSAGQKMSNGSRLRFVKDYVAELKKQESAKVATEFPLHSLRVSLITCYTMDTDLPLPVISKLLAGHSRLLMTIYYNKITPSVMAEKMKEANAALVDKGDISLRTFLADAEMNQVQLRTAYQQDQHNSVESVLANRNPIGWEERATGICLVGGNTVRSDELSTIGGCWNGGSIIKDFAAAKQRVYGPVPHGPENCVRCRWHITDATYLPALISKFNQISYKAHQAAELAVEIEGQLEVLKDELFIAEEAGEVFLKHSELQALERRYEKQRVEADEYAKDYIATFNLINRVIQIENGRGNNDECQKLIAVGSSEDLNVSMKFIETDSELLHLSLLCEDAEFHPDLHDDLRKTPAIAKRTNALSRMMARSGYQPIFLEMDERTQLIAGNAIMRKMAKISNPDDKLVGYRIAANYIEAQEYLSDAGLLKSAFEAVKNIAPITLPPTSMKRIPSVEVGQ